MPARWLPKRLDKREVLDCLLPNLYVAGKRNCWIWVNPHGRVERYPQRDIGGKPYRLAALLLWALGWTDEVLAGDRSVFRAFCRWCRRVTNHCGRCRECLECSCDCRDEIDVLNEVSDNANR